jgi:hypothetical protein
VSGCERYMEVVGCGCELKEEGELEGMDVRTGDGTNGVGQAKMTWIVNRPTVANESYELVKWGERSPITQG